MLRRFLSLLLAAGLSTLLLFVVFQNVSWRALPQAIGLGEEFPTDEEIEGGESIVPDLRTSKPHPTDPKAHENANRLGIDVQMPYPEGQTKPAGSNYTKTLVIASTRAEDTSWVENELGDILEPRGSLSHAIYVVDDKSAPLHPPKNKGHEVMVYLSYIIDFYEDLPDVSIFMHAHQHAWHNNELLDQDAAQMVRYLSPERVTRKGYMNLRCHWDPGCPTWLHPGAIERNYEKQEEHLLATSWAELFPQDLVPTVLSQPCCGQFAVSRERILSLPKQRYVYMRDWVLRTELSDYLSGRIFEYIWQFIFSASPTHCPAMNACYCDGYGLCFGGPEAFNDWFKLRFEMNELKHELKIWQEKADLIEQFRKHTKDGKMAEEALLEVPEIGRDVELNAQIDRYKAELDKRKEAAIEVGRDPRQRALEAGREWHEGDGNAISTGTSGQPLATSTQGATITATAPLLGSSGPAAGTFDSEAPVLPFNLDKQFGGFDASRGLGDLHAFKTNLFDLSQFGESEYAITDINYGTNNARFKYPRNLTFAWGQIFHSQILTGETKASYQSTLSQSFSMSVGLPGFTAEIDDTFAEMDSSLDVRVEGIAVKHGTALGIKVKDTDPASNISMSENVGEQDSDTKAIHDMIGTVTTTTIGGTYVGEGHNDTWAASLYRDPAILDMDLLPISDLIVDNPTKQAEVLQLLTSRLEAAAVKTNARALCMWQSFESSIYDDRNTRSKRNIATACVGQKQGWFSLDQYACGGDKSVHDWKPSCSNGLLLANVPGQPTIVRAPDAYIYRWALTNHGGFSMYEMAHSNTSFKALSAFFFDHRIPSTDDFGGARVVHEGLLLGADASLYLGESLWDDHGTRAKDSGSAWQVSYTDPNVDYIQRQKDINAENQEAYLFHAGNKYNKPDTPAYAFDLSQCATLSNTYL